MIRVNRIHPIHVSPALHKNLKPKPYMVHRSTILWCIAQQTYGASLHNLMVHRSTILWCIAPKSYGASLQYLMVHRSTILWILWCIAPQSYEFYGASLQNFVVHRSKILWCLAPQFYGASLHDFMVHRTILNLNLMPNPETWPLTLKPSVMKKWFSSKFLS